MSPAGTLDQFVAAVFAAHNPPAHSPTIVDVEPGTYGRIGEEGEPTAATGYLVSVVPAGRGWPDGHVTARVTDRLGELYRQMVTCPPTTRFTVLPEPVRTPSAGGGLWDDAEIIDAYTRKDAIADGALVDVSDTAREAGITFPVAVTRAVWEDCVAWSDADNTRKGTLQDEPGRLWDVVKMLSFALQAANARGDGDSPDLITYRIVRVPRQGRGRLPRHVQLRAVCGPGDNAEPVITVMEPGES